MWLALLLLTTDTPLDTITKMLQVVQPTVLLETDYRVYPSEIEGNTGFALGRLRPGLIIAPVSWLRLVTTIEWAGENPIILDAYARFRATDWLEFTLGYSKPPLFASFIYEQENAMVFPDRSPVIETFHVNRDLGADVHFAPRNVPIEAMFRVGNGTGSPLGNDNALPAGYGNVDLVLGRAWLGSAEDDRFFGLRLGAAGFIESARDRDGMFGRTPLGFVYARPIVISGLRLVGEGHIIAYAGPVRLTIEGAIAREARSRDDDGNPATPRLDLPAVTSYGVTSEVAWVLMGGPRLVGRFPSPRVDEEDNWAGGALELGARYDGLWLNGTGSNGGALSLKWWATSFLSASVTGYLTRYLQGPIEAPNTLWSWGMIARASFFWGLPNGRVGIINERNTH